MLPALQEKIISFIPSKSLQNAIKASGYLCSDAALLSIVFDYSPNFDLRIEHLKLLSGHFSGEIRRYTDRLIDTQQRMRDAFLKKEPGAVYELHIKQTPDAYDETYLCDSFQSAMEMIPLFFSEYDCAERPETRYRIVKRRVFSGGRDPFSEDYLGEATLLPGKILHCVSMEGFRAEDCGEKQNCLDCSSACVLCHEPPFPCFVSDRDVVQYPNGDGKKVFGVVLQEDSCPTSEYYIIPLDSEEIYYHDFDNIFNSHAHIPAPLVEKSSPDQLPDKLREDYFAYLEYLKNYNETLA